MKESFCFGLPLGRRTLVYPLTRTKSDCGKTAPLRLNDSGVEKDADIRHVRKALPAIRKIFGGELFH